MRESCDALRWEDSRRNRADSARAILPLTGLLILLAAVCLSGCQNPVVVGSPGSYASEGRPSFIDGYPAFPIGEEASGLVHVVVEIPAGTNDKWEVDKETGGLRWEEEHGAHRVVRYLAYPGNYGMIPSTILPREVGGDGDPLDVVLLGPAIERGSVVVARPVGLLRLLDGGERDDKILAVQENGPLSEVRDLATLDANYRGARDIIETWFTNYKGPGRMTSEGFGDVEEAVSVVREASRHFLER